MKIFLKNSTEKNEKDLRFEKKSYNENLKIAEKNIMQKKLKKQVVIVRPFGL